MQILILGAGGHAQVVADMLLQTREAGQKIVPIGYLDDNPALHGKMLLNLPVLGDISVLEKIPHEAVVIAIGNNQMRRRLAEDLVLANETFLIARHPSSVIAPDVRIGPGTMICAGAIVNTGSAIGAHVILNTGCTVDHHSVVGDYVHIAPGVHMGGEVVIEEGALIGIGATIAPRMSVGAWATVGAGAVVTKPVPPGVTVVGVPAKPLQKG